jgi:hypothetical protein
MEENKEYVRIWKKTKNMQDYEENLRKYKNMLENKENM